MKMTEEQFIGGFVDGRFGEIEFPETIYKKGTGELSAEKVMILVLKARSRRKEKPVTKEVTQNESCPN